MENISDMENGTTRIGIGTWYGRGIGLCGNYLKHDSIKVSPQLNGQDE